VHRFRVNRSDAFEPRPLSLRYALCGCRGCADRRRYGRGHHLERNQPGRPLQRQAHSMATTRRHHVDRRGRGRRCSQGRAAFRDRRDGGRGSRTAYSWDAVERSGSTRLLIRASQRAMARPEARSCRRRARRRAEERRAPGRAGGHPKRLAGVFGRCSDRRFGPFD